MSRYDDMRAAVLAAQRAMRQANNSHYGYGWHREKIAGIEFAMKATQQTVNGRHATQVLHYVEGKRVSARTFFDHAAQLGVNLLAARS